VSGGKLVWVAALATTYTLDGTSYGPSSTPVQVPANLAQALGLPEVDAPAAYVEDDGADIQDLLDANASLKADLDKAHATLQEVAAQRDAGGEQAVAFASEAKRLSAELDASKARVAELEAQLAQSAAQGSDAPPAEDAKPAKPSPKK